MTTTTANMVMLDFVHASDWNVLEEYKGLSDMYLKDEVSLDEEYEFPVGEFSSSGSNTPDPVSEHLADPHAMDYCSAYDHIEAFRPLRAADRSCGEAMGFPTSSTGCIHLNTAEPLSSRSSFSSITSTVDNNPYAKPRMTFRNNSPSLRVVRPATQVHVPASTPKGETHQPQNHVLPVAKAVGRPRPKTVARLLVSNKTVKVCSYDLCPSPLQSNKWRTVTQGTSAGSQVWEPLVGKMLCDSCYSTFRKHGTLVRSVRTAEGWARLDSDGTVFRPNYSKMGRTKRQPGPTVASSSPTKQRKRAAALDVNGQTPIYAQGAVQIHAPGHGDN